MVDKITKLLKKVSEKDRTVLKQLLLDLSLEEKRRDLNATKLQGTDFFRLRKGSWRIIFHMEKRQVVVDAIRLRNEKTYRDI